MDAVFLRKTSKKYDLMVYALVDSLVLHSGYSSLRLESFLFTQQAFDDIAARLKPNGVFAAYNFFRQGWIVGRIDKMAEQAFGDAAAGDFPSLCRDHPAHRPARQHHLSACQPQRSRYGGHQPANSRSSSPSGSTRSRR